MIRLWNTAAGTITGVPKTDVLGQRIEDVIKGWEEIAPLIPVASKPGDPVRAETVPVEFGGRELWISGSGVGFEEGTVYAFRDLTEERALEEMQGRLRRDGLTRAAHAAGRDLRLGADDPAHGHRARAGRSATSCSA